MFHNHDRGMHPLSAGGAQNAPGWGAKLGLVGCKIIKKRPGWGAKSPKMTLSGVQIRPKRHQVGCIVSFKPI